MKNESIEISGQQLIQFCSKINTRVNCPITVKYCETFGTTGDYAKLAGYFSEQEKEEVSTDDGRFYKKLRKSQSDTYCFSFSDGTSVSVKYNDYYLNGNDKNQEIIDPKWHWLISVFAYLDVVNNECHFEEKNYPKEFKASKVNKNGRVDFETKFKVDYNDEINKETRWQVAVAKAGKLKTPRCFYSNMKLWLAEASGMDVSAVDKCIKGGNEQEAKEEIKKIQYSEVCKNIVNILKEEKLLILRNSEQWTWNSDVVLKVNRSSKQLELYKKVDNSVLYKYYSIRPDFDSSNYIMYEKVKSMDCIYGGEKSPTPTGIFQVEKKSTEEYISGYYPELDQVKFFGYLVIFEDYFIHSDLYAADVTKETLEENEPVSKGDTSTSGCIRISQEDLDWLLENVEVGTPVIM